VAKQSKPKAETFEIPDRILVVTTRGVEVECLPISAELEQMEANIRAAFTWPEAPQRVMRDVAGTEAHVDITPEFLATPEATEAQKIAYADYKVEFDRVAAEFNDRRGNANARLIALRGVRVTDPALPERWQADHEWVGMGVPADPRERALHFFLTEIVGNPAVDMAAIMIGIYRASGSDSEVLDKVEASFRDTLGRGNGAGIGGNPAGLGAAGQAQAPGGKLGGRPVVDHRRGRKGTRAKAGRAASPAAA